MLRHFVTALGIALIAGCSASVTNPEGSSASTEVKTPIGNTASTSDAQTIAFAARAQHPSGQAQDSKYTAVVTPSGDIQLVNPTDQELDNAALWVNGKYVTQVQKLPARSTTTVSKTSLYDRDGRQMSFNDAKLDQLQLQSGDKLFTVSGPAYNNK